MTDPLRGLNVHLLLEPGRAIVGPAGVLVTSVLYRKENDGKRFLVVDAAMNDLIRPALYGAYHEIVPVVQSKDVVRLRKKLSMSWGQCASPAISSRAIGSCLEWKKATCLRFLMPELMGWRWLRTTTRARGQPRCWLAENQ